MALRLSDNEIAVLLAEPKPLPRDYRSRVELKAKRGHREQELDINGGGGSSFRLILRQSTLNQLDFSVVLAYCLPNSSQVFRIRRYNGRSHEHSNSLERRTFYDFHVHMATERYQLIGAREDSYAEPTDRYGDYQGAVMCLLKDCGFQMPTEWQLDLF